MKFAPRQPRKKRKPRLWVWKPAKAFLPRKMHDGTWVWLETYLWCWIKEPGGKRVIIRKIVGDNYGEW